MSNFLITGYYFGHKIYSEDGINYFYDDNNKKVPEKRKCPKCNEYPTEDDHDPCIKNLPGVKYACCGHGVEEGYVVFENGIVLRGEFKIKDD